MKPVRWSKLKTPSLQETRHSRLRDFLADRRGNVTLITALMAPILAMLVGGGLTLAEANAARTNLQDALDSSVLAGVAESSVVEIQLSTARRVFASNSAVLGGKGVTAAFQSDGTTLSGTARLSVTPFLPGFSSLTSIPVSVEAAARKPKIGLCILGLNNLDNGAFDINGTPDFKAPDCAVQANSGSRRAMTQEGGVRAEAGFFGVHGGEDTNNFFPAPEVESPKIADPYLNIAFPSHGACPPGASRKGLVIDADTRLTPGTYCGGINITGRDTRVTMAPGVYVMVDGPLLVNGNARLSGEEVMVAFTGSDSTLRVWGSSSVDLTSPTAGIYKNMQFFQDRTDPKGRGAWVSVGGNGGPNDATDLSKLKIDGVAYFPTQNFWIYGKADVDINSPGLAIVADKIWFQGAATIDVTSVNTRNLTNIVGGFANPKGAWLIK